MALPAQVARVAINGHLAQGEVFTTGYWIFAGATLNSQAACDALATFIAGDIVANNVGKTVLSTDSAYTDVKVYAYNTGGSAPADFISDKTCALTGSGGGSLPLQAAIVVSLRTAVNTARGRGRMYIPADGATLAAHQLSTPSPATVGAEWAGHLSRVNANSDTQTVSVVSTAGGVVHPVLNVIVDSRIDIQRRRANKQSIVSSSTVAVTV
jgi:poly(3-hydroxybutyrate) depolymerase